MINQKCPPLQEEKGGHWWKRNKADKEVYFTLAYIRTKTNLCWPVVVAQLMEWSLPAGSSPAIGQIYIEQFFTVNYIEKTKIKEKEAGNGPLKATLLESERAVGNMIQTDRRRASINYCAVCFMIDTFWHCAMRPIAQERMLLRNVESLLAHSFVLSQTCL